MNLLRKKVENSLIYVSIRGNAYIEMHPILYAWNLSKFIHIYMSIFLSYAVSAYFKLFISYLIYLSIYLCIYLSIYLRRSYLCL